MLRPVGGEQEAQAALQSVKAEKQALEECLSATASAQRHTPPSAQPAPVTPQPHRSSNPSSAKLSEGTAAVPAAWCCWVNRVISVGLTSDPAEWLHGMQL